MSTESSAEPFCKIAWPSTYVERLQAVTMELRKMPGPITVDHMLERFTGVSLDEVEAALAALVLFRRIDKKGNFFSIPADS